MLLWNVLDQNDENAQLTSEHLESFANEGLRTLCLGYRILTTGRI